MPPDPRLVDTRAWLDKAAIDLFCKTHSLEEFGRCDAIHVWVAPDSLETLGIRTAVLA